MTSLTLTKTRMTAGIWRGILTGAAATPRLSVTHHSREVPGVTVIETKQEATWLVEVPIPSEIIADGTQTLLISDEETGMALHSVTLIAPDRDEEDLRAEVDLLRAELDMLKRAFRRHCRETL